MPVGEGWGRCQVWLTAYLAAEAEAQGQEAEEVLAPSDHAGEAPAQSSHTDPQGGCLGERVGEGGPAAPGAELGRGWVVRVKTRALPRGCLGSSAPQEQPECPAPSSGRSRAKAPRRCPEMPPSPRKPLREAPPLSGTSSAAPSLLPSA